MNPTPSRRSQAIAPLLAALLAVLGSASACSDGGLTPIELPVASLEVVNGCEFMAAGETCQIVVNAFDEEGRRLQNPILRYQTTTTNVLAVNDDGLVTARATGRGIVLVQSTTGSATVQLDILVTLRSDRDDGEA